MDPDNFLRESDQSRSSFRPGWVRQSQGSKCLSLPGLTHGINPGLPGLGFKPYFGKVGNTGESNILNVQNCANL